LKAVVTGAAGFIGSHVVESLLGSGFEVLGIDAFVDYYPRLVKESNLAAARASKAFRLVEGTLETLDLPPLLAGATAVYHLAAQAGVRASWGRDFSLYSNHNLLGTQRLLEACLEEAPPRVVYASSSSVYGDSRTLPLKEDAACHPLSPYGVTKLAAEHLCLLYQKNYGVPVVCLRYFTVYGPRQRPDMAFHRFLAAARDRTPIRVFGDGEQTRDFTFVGDVVEATRAAATTGHPGSVYNIGGGERASVNAILARISEITGVKLDILYEEVQKGDMRDTYADTALARRELGFEPRVGLAEGLNREWAWLRGLS
jgi:nucleoside-diphosphate-sugar epimerase